MLSLSPSFDFIFNKNILIAIKTTFFNMFAYACLSKQFDGWASGMFQARFKQQFIVNSRKNYQTSTWKQTCFIF